MAGGSCPEGVYDWVNTLNAMYQAHLMTMRYNVLSILDEQETEVIASPRGIHIGHCRFPNESMIYVKPTQ